MLAHRRFIDAVHQRDLRNCEALEDDEIETSALHHRRRVHRAPGHVGVQFRNQLGFSSAGSWFLSSHPAPELAQPCPPKLPSPSIDCQPPDDSEEPWCKGSCLIKLASIAMDHDEGILRDVFRAGVIAEHLRGEKGRGAHVASN